MDEFRRVESLRVIIAGLPRNYEFSSCRNSPPRERSAPNLCKITALPI